MEARARYDYVASTPDEVSFSQGNILRIILLVTEYSKWYWGLNWGNRQQGYIHSDWVNLNEHEFYAGRMTEETATRLLSDPSYILPEGTFFIRQSTDLVDDWRLEVLSYGKVNHFTINIDGQGDYFVWVQKFANLNHLVRYYTTTAVQKDPYIILNKTMLYTHYTDWKPYPTAKVMHDFAAQAADELSVKKGEVVTVKDMTHADWWDGYINGRTGNIPANYVQLLTKVGRALHDFTASEAEAGELSFKKGDLIILDTFEGDWWKGRMGIEEGDIPANYIEIVKA